MLQQSPLDLDHIPNGNGWKIPAIRPAGFGIFAAWARGSSAAAQQVRANDEETVRVDGFAWAYGNFPPPRVIGIVVPGNMRIAADCMTNQYRIVACRVEVAVSFVSNSDVPKLAAFFQ